MAEVEQVVPHPNADKLLLLTVRVGEATKQVVAGIKAYRQPDDLVGKQIIIVNNLEPATLRGERSEGMLLAVVAGDQFALVSPDARVAHGARVS